MDLHRLGVSLAFVAACSSSESGATSNGSLDASTLTDAAIDAPDAAAIDAAQDASDAGDEPAVPQPCVATNGVVTLTRGDVRLDIDLTAGSATFSYAGAAKIRGFYAGVQLAAYTTSRMYSSRTCTILQSTATVTSTGSGLPTMQQVYTLDGGNHFLAQVSVSGAGLRSNWISPIVTDAAGAVDVGAHGDPRILWIPFDNDAWVSYNALPMKSTGTSYEAAAFYDNTSRNGIVVGSITHDTWKTGVYYQGGANTVDAMHVFGGAVDATWTHDPLPHGQVSSAVIASPVVFAGYAPDWRDLLEEYADANAARMPKLPWSGGVPFGWNSWPKLQSAITHDKAVAASDFIHTSLQPTFSNSGAVYINLDSYWDNLTDAQLMDFVAHCHANGQKAGIYWAPFVDWGKSATRAVEGAPGTTYQQIWLQNASGQPIALDGAYAVDPTHPATQARIDYYIDKFKSFGFEYVKLDFLSHGALESTARFDPKVQTGIQAYNQGMKHIVDRIAGTMFISESIAPLFPAGYGHARRVSCDVSGAAVSNTGASYELNSVTYGWWMSGRMYAYNDPDAVLFEGYTASDNMTRLLSAVVSGTVFLDGDDLSGSTGQTLAQSYLTNARINDVARLGKPFSPVEGNTGTAPSDVFVLRDGAASYLAVFNFGSSATTKVVDLARAGLDGAATYAVTDLWSGAMSTAKGTLSVALEAGFGKLFALR